MGQPNFDAFLNTPAETPKETKKKVQGDTPKFSINKTGWSSEEVWHLH